MPPAGQTISTTRITLPPKSSPAWLDRVDTGSIALEHAHPSLVVMTSAMQAVFGLLCALLLNHSIDPISLTLLLVITIGAINTSIFHLGRPAYAWRALKMWKRSWLSREVLCFTLFLITLTLCTAASWTSLPSIHNLTRGLALAAAAIGLAGTLASARIYLVKARPAWNLVHTPLDFVLSSFLIASPLAAGLSAPAAWLSRQLTTHGVPVVTAPFHLGSAPTVIVAALWVTNQMVRLIRLRTSTNFEMRAAYHHLRGEQLWWKVGLSWLAAAQAALFFAIGLSTLSFVAAIAAVMINRYLFFVSVVPLSMGLTFIKPKMTHGRAA